MSEVQAGEPKAAQVNQSLVQRVRGRQVTAAAACRGRMNPRAVCRTHGTWGSTEGRIMSHSIEGKGQVGRFTH